MNVSNQFELMLERFNADAAGSMDAVFQYQIEDAGEYYLTIKDGLCSMTLGEHESPTVSLSLSEETLAEIMEGETDGMQAFMSGQLKATGDLMLATRLPELFPISE